MTDLDGRVALITGASRGLGAAIAKQLDERGMSLALGSRSGGDLGIQESVAAPCDVRDPAQVEALVAAAVERFGGLDVVVANAGVGGYGEFVDGDPEFDDEIVDVSVKGLLHTVRAVAPDAARERRRRPRGGRLDRGAARARGRGRLRGGQACPGRLHALARPRALEQGVRCSIICPGGIATEFAMGRGRRPDDPDLAGFMSADEVAEAVVYALGRPRTQRVLEMNLLPMAEDSMG